MSDILDGLIEHGRDLPLGYVIVQQVVINRNGTAVTQCYVETTEGRRLGYARFGAPGVRSVEFWVGNGQGPATGMDVVAFVKAGWSVA